jgi:hypothetical protein
LRECWIPFEPLSESDRLIIWINTFKKSTDFTIVHARTKGYQLVLTVVMKNCEPFVFGPAFAIDKIPATNSLSDILLLALLIV